MQLPISFLNNMRAQLGEETEAFLHALDQPVPVSIHFNSLKKYNREENYEGVKWHPEGVYLPERPVFTLDPSFHAGAYYVQEASSMLVAEATRQLLDLSGALRVLDLCAAPGGKSTLLASLISTDSLLLANEVIRSRYQVLDYNLTKWGQPNKITTSQDVEQFKNIDSFFDLILIDAPCSGEGLFRKDPQAVAEWSPENVLKCSARQKRILGHTIDLLKPGGILLYSTCTYNESENQENADWLLREFPLEVAPLELQPDWGIVNRSIGYQCYPHRLKGEGFYLAAFRKTGVPARRSRGKLPTRFRHFQPLSKSKQAPLASFIRQDADLVYLESDKGQVTALPAAIYQDALRISPHLRYSRMGTPIGRFKGKDLIPAPELVFSSLLRSDLPGIEVDRESALSFLRKEMLSIAAVPGWQLIKHQGLPLGWIKGLKNRINNYYPKEWRIRMQGNN